MGDMASFCLLSIAVFCGAFVSGLAGFAFSAVAGAILLHVLPPREAVPLMMACSITVQAAGLWALRKSIRWKQSSGLVVGGLLGVPIAVWLLQAADADLQRELWYRRRLLRGLHVIPAGAFSSLADECGT